MASLSDGLLLPGVVFFCFYLQMLFFFFVHASCAEVGGLYGMFFVGTVSNRQYSDRGVKPEDGTGRGGLNRKASFAGKFQTVSIRTEG